MFTLSGLRFIGLTIKPPEDSVEGNIVVDEGVVMDETSMLARNGSLKNCV